MVLVASRETQGGKLILVLDSFGNDDQGQRAGQANDRSCDGAGTRFGTDLADEHTVDLEGRHGEPLEVGKA